MGHTAGQYVHVGFFKAVLGSANLGEPPTVLGMNNAGMDSFGKSCSLFYSSPEAFDPNPVAFLYSQTRSGGRMYFNEWVRIELAQGFDLSALGTKEGLNSAPCRNDERESLE